MSELTGAAMMDVPLDLWLLFNNARRHHHRTEVVSRLPSGEIHRYTYAELTARAQQLMGALDALEIASGERVATLAWNSYRHVEAYFAVPCTGRVLHTLNVRLSVDELAFVMNDADDRAVLVDPEFLPIIAQVAPLVPGLRHVLVLDATTSELDESALSALNYEHLIAAHPTTYEQPVLNEYSPSGLCYTSGTTGRPKGVVSTHRSTYLHAMGVSSGAGMAVGPGDVVLPQVPMFHASAWGLVHAAVGVGAGLALYGGALEPAPFVDLLERERITIAAGVPTVWLSVIDELTQRTEPLRSMRHIVCGGSQPPRSLIERFQREHGVPIVQAWGMTETSPLASLAWPQSRMREWPDEAVLDTARTRAGLPIPGVEVSIRSPEDKEVPHDGETMGALHVRGPWVAAGYLHDHGSKSFTEDGWFDTGDVAVAHPDGYFVITDRTKDLIKSGGEWISSVDMEAALMGMPDVLEAAVIAIPDDRWLERPRPAWSSGPGPSSPPSRPANTSRRVASLDGNSLIASKSSMRSPRPLSASSTRRSCDRDSAHEPGRPENVLPPGRSDPSSSSHPRHRLAVAHDHGDRRKPRHG
jgi:fatty-acyl-CoA synthase